MGIKIYPYRRGSRSARRLAYALTATVLRLEGGTYSPRSEDTIINWGNSSCPFRNLDPARVLNPGPQLAVATNKRSAFRIFSAAGVTIPRFAETTGAVSWDGLTVVRHKLAGHSGEGIEIVGPGIELPSAPLYVEYVKKQDEYRVHVMGQSIILVQRKARRKDHDNPNWRVRNHANGFVFARDGVSPPVGVLDEAKAAITALGLDFGAVDILWNKEKKKAFVLEVNTAPGMEGSTIEDYAQGFRAMVGG